MKKILLSAAILAASQISYAEDAPVEAGIAEEQPSPWSGFVELGAVSTTGNSENSNFKAGFEVVYGKDNWTHKLYGDAYQAESKKIEDEEREKTADRFLVGAKSDYKFGKHAGAFGRAHYEDDEFTDYNYTVSGAAGYEHRFIESDKNIFFIEVGPGYTYFNRKEGENTDSVTAFGLANYQYNFTEKSYFKQVLTTNVAFEDDASTISRSLTELVTQVNGSLMLKLTYEIKHDDMPGQVENFEEIMIDREKVDTIAAVTLMYKF